MARCAVRAASERRNHLRENTGFRLLNAAGDIAARCSPPPQSPPISIFRDMV